MKLAAIPWRPTKHDGIQVHFYDSDERSKRVLALIRMDPGCGYPAHRHRSIEEVLVVHGGYRDELGEYRAGELVRYEAGSEHAPIAIGGAGDEPCVLLALAHEGIKLLG